MKNKRFKFSLTDNTSYAGKDAYDFYSKALLEGGSRSTFRVIPGVKNTIKVPRYDAGNIIKEAGCAWGATGEGTLNQKDLSVCAKDVQLELCETTFENNFLSEVMKDGHLTGQVAPDVFLNYMVNQVGKKIENDLELATWGGNAGSTGANAQTYPYSICDGIEILASRDNNVEYVAGVTGGLSTSNVIAEMTRVYNKIPKTIVSSPEMRIYVSDHIARLYMQAIAAQSNEAYFVGAKELNYLGIPIIRAQGMSDGVMIAAKTDNLILLTDLLSDEESLNVIPQFPVTGTRTVRIAGGFKFGVDYLVSEEVVYYKGNA